MASRSVMKHSSRKRESRNPCLTANLTLAGLLMNHPQPIPPAGAGRVHRLADDETRVPDEIQRYLEYRAAVRDGADTLSAIMKRLSFAIDDRALRTDLRELMRRGGIGIRYQGGSVRYIPIPDRGSQP